LQAQARFGLRYNDVRMGFFFGVVIGVVVVGLVCAEDKTRAGWAEDNVRAVQQKLLDGGFYSGEVDGAYSSDLTVALTRYQIRNGLSITGQLDPDTSKALGVKPAVTSTAADLTKTSETWRRLRAGDQQARTNAPVAQSPRTDETARSNIAMTTREGGAVTGPTSPESAQPAPAPQATVSATASTTANLSTETLRDYVGAFVLAGLDAQVGAEADFFADQVQYYDQGVMTREKIRQDLRRYAKRWPKRQFWIEGEITVEPQNDGSVRVTFPLRYELRHGAKHSSGKVNKTLVLKPSGYDLLVAAVNERKAE
jgi:hypothetical protein